MPSTLKKALWPGLLLLAIVAPLSSHAAEKVSLQLRWDHQFQFAGYYAALFQGYYEEAGLDVEIRSAIREGKPRLFVIDEVANGKADFGVGSVDALVARDKGKPVILAANIFQQSAVRIFSRKEVNVKSPADLVGLRVRRTADDLTDVELRAVLRAEGINPEKVGGQSGGRGFNLLLTGKIDAYAGYILTGLWRSKQLGLPLNMLHPSTYGVDFYGDGLITNKNLAESNPELVERFVNASLKGWRYALKNPEKTIDTFIEKMPRTLPIEDIKGFNSFQSDEIRKLTLYPTVEIGHVNPERWRRIYDELDKAKLVSGTLKMTDFIFDPVQQRGIRQERLLIFLVASVGGLAFFSLFFLLWTRTLRKTVTDRTAALRESQDLYRSLVQSQSDLICRSTPEGILTFSNQSYADFVGKSPEQLVGEPIFEDVPEAEHHRLKSHFLSLSPEQPKASIENENLDKFGNSRLFQWNNHAHFDEQGNFIELQSVGRDITEIRKSKETAELANKAKSQFLASMSHELRTPLNAVLGFAQLMQIDPNNSLNKTQNEQIENIIAGGNHLLELVNEILDLAKVEAVEIELSFEDVNVSDVIADCVGLAAPLGEKRKIQTIDKIANGTPTHLETDRLRLKQAVLNLLSNAVKFNKDRGTVIVTDEKTDDGFYRISVQDTGAGIAIEDYPGVFQMFHRLGADPMITREGTGIGLAVTKLLLEKMGGRVGFTSELDVGSTFWLDLPLEKLQTSAQNL
jgi:PAS domain S-box-containing protein